jgi:hypothetical protein
MQTISYTKIEDPKERLMSQVHKELVSRELQLSTIDRVISKLKEIPNIETNNYLVLSASVHIIKLYPELLYVLLKSEQESVLQEMYENYSELLTIESSNIIKSTSLKTKKSIDITPILMARTKIDILTCIRLIYDDIINS